MKKDIPELKLDRTAIKKGVSPEDAEAAEIEYWRNTTVRERLQHIERLRRLNYGHRATERLQRVIRIVECE